MWCLVWLFSLSETRKESQFWKSAYFKYWFTHWQNYPKTNIAIKISGSWEVPALPFPSSMLPIHLLRYLSFGNISHCGRKRAEGGINRSLPVGYVKCNRTIEKSRKDIWTWLFVYNNRSPKLWGDRVVTMETMDHLRGCYCCHCWFRNPWERFTSNCHLEYKLEEYRR